MSAFRPGRRSSVCLLGPVAAMLLSLSACSEKAEPVPTIMPDMSARLPANAPPESPEKLVDAKVPVQAAKLKPIVYLEVVDDPPAASNPPDSLRREIARQALLLTARDRLGLSTRDETLREPAPADLAKENRLRVHLTRSPAQIPQFSVERTGGKAEDVLWRQEGKPLSAGPTGLVGMLTWLELKSRTDLKEALLKAGFEGKPVADNPAMKLDAEVEKQLQQMSFPVQFAAVQSLHEAMRSQGRSPALLAALARGYAHLGLLSECLWSNSYKVYSARALLYAQELCAADTESPTGVWLRAYATALAGEHKAALAELELAGKMREAAAKKNPGQPTPEPSWVALIEAYCKFDTIKLKEAAQKAEDAQLAAVLNFVASESLSGSKFTLEAAGLALEKTPDCTRIYDSLAARDGISTQHASTLINMELFAPQYYARLGSLTTLPEAVKELVSARKPESAVNAALRKEALDSNKSTEPSWAALASWAQDERFLQVCERLNFMRYRWAVPIDDFLPQIRPLVADHPYVAYVDCFALDNLRQKPQLAQALARLPLKQFDARALSLWSCVNRENHDLWVKEIVAAGNRSDCGYYGLAAKLRTTGIQNNDGRIYALLQASPYSPQARAYLVAHAWSDAERDLDKWQKDSQHPELLLALGRHYLAANELDKAEDYFKRAINLSPEYPAFRSLADVYKKQNKTDQWAATLEKVLQEVDTGLEHARVQVELARHFMSLKDFKRAQPYADAAAETWAAWAMLCAADCYEGLGEWEKAELWVQRTSERYDDSRSRWFFWCKRTGKGDLAAATKMFEAELAQRESSKAPRDYLSRGIFARLTGQPKQAGEAYRSYAKLQPKEWSAPVLAAICFDEAGADAECKAMLESVGAGSPFATLAKNFQVTLGKGKDESLDMRTVDVYIEGISPNVRAMACYLIGCFTAKHGPKDASEKYLRRAMALSPQTDSTVHLLANAKLQ